MRFSHPRRSVRFGKGLWGWQDPSGEAFYGDSEGMGYDEEMGFEEAEKMMR
jgi:hypothetical protein